MRSMNISYKIVFLFAIMATAYSCKKPGVDPITTEGQTIVKLAQSDFQLVALDLVNTSQTFTIDLRRDVPNESELNKPLTVVLALDPAVLSAYNTAHSTSYVQLPASSYTLGQGAQISGNNISVAFAPGEFAKQLQVTVPDATVLDPNTSYALGLKIASAEGAKISTALTNLVTEVGLKNMYDGTYTLEGAFYHPTSSPNYAPFTITAELHTSGANSVRIFIPDFGGYYGPGLFSGTLNAFGAQEPEITIDPVTNKAVVQNSYPGAVTFYTMAPGYDSRYDPATKKIYVKYGYNYSPGPVFNPAANREWTYVFTYKGPR